MIRQSNYSVAEFLAAGPYMGPNGKEVTTNEVTSEQVTTVILAGRQTFGSGGYRADAVFAGEEPEIRRTWQENTDFTSVTKAEVKLKPGSVLFCFQSDAVSRAGRAWRQVYVCRA